MASFYAELEVAGHTYPVRGCHFKFTQATNERGRVAAKVRHGLVHVTLDVPDDEVLAAWGTAAHQPLAGHVTFFETDRRTARETVAWDAGECVGYHESFAAGDTGDGAYVCQLVISAPRLVLTPGGPARALAAATPRDYATALPPALAASIKTAMATPVLSKQQRYDARMSLLGNARAQLAQGAPAAGSPLAAKADATRVAPSASATRLRQERQRVQAATDRLARNNVAVERARLSEHVYSSDKVPPVPASEGWHQLSVKELAKRGVTPAMLTDPKSGFKAALYQSAFERPPKLVVAYAGTENGPDLDNQLAARHRAGN